MERVDEIYAEIGRIVVGAAGIDERIAQLTEAMSNGQLVAETSCRSRAT